MLKKFSPHKTRTASAAKLALTKRSNSGSTIYNSIYLLPYLIIFAQSRLITRHTARQINRSSAPPGTSQETTRIISIANYPVPVTTHNTILKAPEVGSIPNPPRAHRQLMTRYASGKLLSQVYQK